MKEKCLQIKRRKACSQIKKVICHFKIVNELQILFDDEKEYDIHTKKALMKYKIIKDNEVLSLEYVISNCWIFYFLNILTTLHTCKTISKERKERHRSSNSRLSKLNFFFFFPPQFSFLKDHRGKKKNLCSTQGLGRLVLSCLDSIV